MKHIQIIIGILFLLMLTCLTGISCAQRVTISEKSKKLFGKVWIYDIKATQKAILAKSVKNTDIKEIEVKDVKKMEDYLTARSLYFAADKQGRGVGFYLTIGKGPLKQKISGWVEWNKTETQMTLSPAKQKNKRATYTVVEILPNKLILLDKESITQIPWIFRR